MLNQTSRRQRWARALVLLAVLVTGIGAFAPQAHAQEDPVPADPTASATASTTAAAGDVYFYHTGDHFYICDNAKDGKSVAVEFYWNRVAHGGNREFDRRWNWWGPYPNGGRRCKDINIDAEEGSIVEFRACLGDYAEPGGKPAKVTTCGGWELAVA